MNNNNNGSLLLHDVRLEAHPIPGRPTGVQPHHKL